MVHTHKSIKQNATKKKLKVLKEKNPYFYSFKDGKKIAKKWQIIIFG